MVKDMKIDITESYGKCPDRFQKIDCLKDLAAGVAHGFNNIFTTIVGCGNMMRMNIDKRDELNAYIDQILKASERALSITNSLLAFSSGLTINPMPVNINEFLMNIKSYLSEMIGDNIRIEMMLCDRQLTVISDVFQMDRIMKILISNANDSMPYGGSLIIKTDAVRLNEWSKEDKGLYALISIKDSGIGMDHKTRERIFDPFFTTKDIGKGMGLGLSIAYGIIRQHNGYIRCLSKPQSILTLTCFMHLYKFILCLTKFLMIFKIHAIMDSIPQDKPF